MAGGAASQCGRWFALLAGLCVCLGAARAAEPAKAATPVVAEQAAKPLLKPALTAKPAVKSARKSSTQGKAEKHAADTAAKPPLPADAAAAPVSVGPQLPSGVQLPIPVHFSARMINLTRMQETLGEVSGVLEFTQSWTDPAMSFKPEVTGVYHQDYVGDDAQALLKTMWSPGAVIENQISSPRSKSVSISVGSDGRVTLIQRVDADFRVTVDMESFPFDHQNLPFDFVSPRYNANELIFVSDDGDLRLSSVEPRLAASNWFGRDMRLATERFYDWNAQPALRVTATARINRTWEKYILRLFVPFFALMSVSIYVLWSKDDKSPIIYSAMLALAALSFTFEASFPGSISMNSPIAFMISIGYFYLIIALLISVVLNYADFPAWRASPYMANEVRQYAKWAVPAIFAILCLNSVLRSMG